MTCKPSDPAEKLAVTATFVLDSGKLEMHISVPAAATRPVKMLPVFHAMADSFVGVAEIAAQRNGLEISCRKGCGACCRQAVPISEIEAHQLGELVAELPEPRRSEIMERFAAARSRLEQAGLLEILLSPESARPEELEALTFNYFKLGLACPFLEDESCSIHEWRPAACREYMVVSPPEHCAQFSPESIKRLKITGRVSKALRVFGADKGMLPNRWVPLILALEWAKTHRDETPERPGIEVLRELLDRVTAQEASEPMT